MMKPCASDMLDARGLNVFVTLSVCGPGYHVGVTG
jgi:hypothetical protein